MTEAISSRSIQSAECFTRSELYTSFRRSGYRLGEAAFYKKIGTMVRSGELVRVGRNQYCKPDGKRQPYRYRYSALAEEVASFVGEHYPYLDFTIFELVQMNSFVNHLIAQNVVFLSVESVALNFVFDSLKDRYPGRVLVDPDAELFHRYRTDHMIVIEKLVTESPRGTDKKWHTGLEKMLVDIVSDPLLRSSISPSEYPGIYSDAFESCYVDEHSLLRYASRRKSSKKVLELFPIQKDTWNAKE